MAKQRNAGADSGAEDPRTSPISFSNGMFTAGDATTIPDGYTLLTRNMVVRPNRICARPPFVYDGLTAVNGFMIWEDLTNQQTRFLALTTNGNLYVKAASGETWSAPITTGLAAGLRLTDYANYRGKLYFMLDDGAGNPTAAAMFDGTTVTVTPFNSAIFARTITTFIDRLFLSYPRVTITNLLTTIKQVYQGIGLGGAGAPFGVNISGSSITNADGSIVDVILPSSTASMGSYVVMGLVNQTKTADGYYVWRCNLRNRNIGVQSIPVTVRITLGNPVGARLTPYLAGMVAPTPPASGYYDSSQVLLKCTTAGTTAAGAVVYNTALGATTVDGSVVWTCIKTSTIVGEVTGTLDADNNWYTFHAAGLVPGTTSTGLDFRTLTLQLLLMFGNSETPSLTAAQLIPIDVGFRDGIADGSPTKANHGQQLTVGAYYFPFVNQESTFSATVNLETIIWSETTDPSNIRAANTYEPKESAGLPTAAVIASGRYIDFKRRAFWVFTGTADPDIPILPESPATIGVGCLGPRAITRLRDELFFIGENEIYRMRVGGYPMPICGDAMRETIMAQGGNWVESQATANMPLIAVDEQRHELWVYTQKSTLFCYHMAPSTAASAPAALYSSAESAAGAWSQHDVNAAEVTAMSYNPTTKKMQFAFLNHGAARFDDTATAQDTINVAGTLYPVTKEITVKPFELTGPRSELCLHDIGLYQLSTGSQAAELLYIYISFDRGKTFTKYNEVRFDPTNPRIPIPIFQSGVSVTIKITAVGKAGEAIFSLSHADATLELLAGEWPLTNPTQIANTLLP